MVIKGQLIDIHERLVFPAELEIEGDLIAQIKRVSSAPEVYILPGFIDAHIHIESSMLTPGAFALQAVGMGTVGVVSDPHEIANVMGVEGVWFMVKDGEKVPLKFWFGAPSCVPATSFETSGGILGVKETEELLSNPGIKYLSEMMNFPGVIYRDKEVLEKISIAGRYNKPVDGHAPGLKGKDLEKYIEAGISTDHECTDINEALDKIRLGMKILIREGSAARNLDALQDLITTNAESVMLCSDDIHPEMLLQRHINKVVSLLIKRGFDVFDVIRCATINPVLHYNLDCGLLRPGDKADFIIVDDYREMNILETWIDGVRLYDRGKTLFSYKGSTVFNNFNCTPVGSNSIEVKRKGDRIRVIKIKDGELFTEEIICDAGKGDVVICDTEKDILKIVVKDRYLDGIPAVGFITGFGMKSGAFASSIAHDSHNIIAVGTDDSEIASAINEVIRCRGGLAVSDSGNIYSMELKVGGIMSDKNCNEVAEDYQRLSNVVKSLGCGLRAPFMTLSFMALLVIPELKIGDRGLFNVNEFKPTTLFV